MGLVFLLIGQNLLSGTKVIFWLPIHPLKIPRPKIQLGNLCPQPHLFSKFKNQNPWKFLIIFSWLPLEILLLFRWGTYLYVSLFHLFVCPSVAHQFSGNIHHLIIILCTHMCKMMISPGIFFIFWKFWFFGLLGG